MILVPKYKDIIVPFATPKSRLSGRFKIEAVGLDGRRRTLADWFPNLITTNGANLIGGLTNCFATCAVGSGNATPALANTALQTLVATSGAATSQTSSSQSSPPYYGTYTLTYTFGTGAAAGNLSEVGVGPSGVSLFSRALILNNVGAPTTITVLSSESLYVTYQINNYVPTADVTGTVVIAGVSYGYTLRAALATSNFWQFDGNGPANIVFQGIAYNGVIGAVTASPSGASAGFDGGSYAGYSNGSFAMVGTITASIGAANVSGGITAVEMLFNGIARYQIGFSAAIPKDSSHVISLTGSTSWAINTP